MASQETVDRAIIAVVVVIGLLGLVMHYGGYSSYPITGQPIAKIRVTAIEQRQPTTTGLAITAQRQQMALGTKNVSAKKSKYPIIKPAAGQRLSAKTARAGELQLVEPERCDGRDNDRDGRIDEDNICLSTCRDNDGGDVAIVPGQVTGIQNGAGYAYDDRCIYDGTMVEEYKCDSPRAGSLYTGLVPGVAYHRCMGGTVCHELPGDATAFCGY